MLAIGQRLLALNLHDSLESKVVLMRDNIDTAVTRRLRHPCSIADAFEQMSNNFLELIRTEIGFKSLDNEVLSRFACATRRLIGLHRVHISRYERFAMKRC